MEEVFRTEAAEARRFKLKEYEGPLDLLLYLIRKNEVNIYDIPISDITRQYMEYLCRADVMDLDDVTEFHSIAAMLLLIKSRTLLPVELEDDDDASDPRQELVERLIDYQKFKKLCELMEEKEKETEWIIERGKMQHILPFSDEDLWETIDIWSLVKIFEELKKKLPGEGIMDLQEEVTVNEKTVLLWEMLENKGECRFTDLIVRSHSVLDIVCAFLAVLEAAKMHLIVVLQNRIYGDIMIMPHKPAADEEQAYGE